MHWSRCRRATKLAFVRTNVHIVFRPFAVRTGPVHQEHVVLRTAVARARRVVIRAAVLHVAFGRDVSAQSVGAPTPDSLARLLSARLAGPSGAAFASAHGVPLGRR